MSNSLARKPGRDSSRAASAPTSYMPPMTPPPANTRARFAALAGAAVFAVHTMFSGVVSYIAGRSSVLCATFYFTVG